MPLEADDAGIFFGREAPVIDALDRLRGLREAPPPRLLVILGASGAGKSSFLRAGLLPRLARDDRQFLALPIIRPERVAILGETGLLRALEGAFRTANLSVARADLRAAIEGGAIKLGALLSMLAKKATPAASDTPVTLKAPTLVLSIDQGEELFLAEGQQEASSSYRRYQVRMVSSSSNRTFAIASQLIPSSSNTSARTSGQTMSGQPVPHPSQLDQVLPQFYVQKAGPYHPFGRIRIAPFGKGGLRILAESG